MRRLGILLCFLSAGFTVAHAQSAGDPLGEGRRHLGEARFADALAAFRSAVRMDSTSTAAWRGMAVALHRLERYPEALDALNRAAALSPQDFGVRFNRALTLSELGQLTAALADLDTAVTLRPEFAPAWTERGAANALLGRLSDARADWQKALTLDSTYIWSRYYRGLSAITSGDYRAAAADLDAVTQREGLLAAHLWRWVAYRLDGRAAPPLPAPGREWPGPIAAFLRGERSATQLVAAAHEARLPIDDRRLASAHFFIAQTYLADNRPDDARVELERVLALRVPRHAEIVAAESMLRRLVRRTNDSL
jgi:tetratricopeptide (TPR) repeat protein